MADKKQFSVRLPIDTAEKVEQYAEEKGIARADALRRAIDAYFVHGGDLAVEVEDEGDRGRGGVFSRVMPSLAAVLLAFALVLPAARLPGARFSLVSGVLATAAVSVGFDDQLDDTIATLSEAIQDMETYHLGAVRRYPLAALRANHPIQNPTTLVERIGRWDLYTPILFAVGVVLGVPLAIGFEAIGLERLVGLLGTGLTLLYVSVVYYLFGFVLGMTFFAKVAQKAVASERTAADEEVADV